MKCTFLAWQRDPFRTWSFTTFQSSNHTKLPIFLVRRSTKLLYHCMFYTYVELLLICLTCIAKVQFTSAQSEKPWSYVILTMILQHRLTLHLMSWQENWKSEKPEASLRSSFFVTSKVRTLQLSSEQADASSTIVYCCWVINTTNKWAMQSLL